MGWQRSLLLAVAAAALAIFAQKPAAAYPDRPVRIVVAFPPGGGPDILARLLAPKLSEKLRQNFFVDNRPGASGIVGTASVARAEPDGYTLMIGSVSTHGTNPAAFKQLPYDAEADFAPIVLVMEGTFVLVVNPQFPPKTVAELIEIAKSRTDLSYASNSFGGVAHLSGELLKLRTGIKMTHVPYRGSGPMNNDLVGGHVMIAFDNLPPALPLIRSGATRALAVTSAKRSHVLPDVPTLLESNIADFDVAGWYGVFGPRGLPEAVVTTLNRAINEILTAPDVRENLLGAGNTVLGGPPEALARKVANEVATWRMVVDRAGIERQ